MDFDLILEFYIVIFKYDKTSLEMYFLFLDLFNTVLHYFFSSDFCSLFYFFYTNTWTVNVINSKHSRIVFLIFDPLFRVISELIPSSTLNNRLIYIRVSAVVCFEASEVVFFYSVFYFLQRRARSLDRRSSGSSDTDLNCPICLGQLDNRQTTEKYA